MKNPSILKSSEKSESSERKEWENENTWGALRYLSKDTLPPFIYRKRLVAIFVMDCNHSYDDNIHNNYAPWLACDRNGLQKLGYPMHGSEHLSMP